VERANADVKEMLATWLSENNSTQSSEGLRFIQFQKNRSYHRVIEQSPYKALFGSDPLLMHFQNRYRSNITFFLFKIKKKEKKVKRLSVIK
jgi:hypothetical protein